MDDVIRIKTESGIFKFDTIEKWISSIGMNQYVDVFKSNAVEISHLQELTDADLQDMGIAAIGHRKTILGSIENLFESHQEVINMEETEKLKARSNVIIKNYFKVMAVLTILCTIIALISEEGDPASVFIVGILGSIGFLIYSLPGLIAFRKGHEYRWAILLGNWLLGVTGIVWLVLLGFAMGLFGSGAAFALAYFADRD